MLENVKDVLITEQEIQAKVEELAKVITEDFRGKPLLIIGVLKGANVFVADLIRKIEIPLILDFMSLSSYGSSTESSGAVRILKDLDEDIKGMHVLVVEDIVDSG